MSEKKKSTKVPKKKEKEKVSSDKETTVTKKSKSPKSSREVSKSSDHEDENLPQREPNVDFEAGVIFNRFDKNGQGVINADDFRKIWREAKDITNNNNNSSSIIKQNYLESSSSSSSFNHNNNPNNLSNIVQDAGGALSFEAGQIFARFDRDHDGKLDKRDFEDVMYHYPNIAATVNRSSKPSSSSSNFTSQPQQQPQQEELYDPQAAGFNSVRPSYPPTSNSSNNNNNNSNNNNNNSNQNNNSNNNINNLNNNSNNNINNLNNNSNNNNTVGMLPMEVITGRLLTHYDETAGVAIPSSSVAHHRSMGNTVAPLVESYRLRYERLRAMLTSRLLPRREHILQLRRQLENCSTDVQAAKRAIEKETMTDAEQIIERLRSAESLRQSAIKQQVLQLEVELESIERTIRKVELANEKSAQIDGSSGIIVTSVSSAIPGHLSSSISSSSSSINGIGGGINSGNNNSNSGGVESVKGHRAANMVELIQQFADISSTIERLSTKALTIQIDFPTTDFPKETSERLDKIARFEKCLQALQIKDQLVWTIMKEKEEREEILIQEKVLCEKYAKELLDWTKLAQNMAKQLNSEKQTNYALKRRNQELIQILRDHNILYVSGDDTTTDGEEEEERYNNSNDNDNSYTQLEEEDVEDEGGGGNEQQQYQQQLNYQSFIQSQKGRNYRY